MNLREKKNDWESQKENLLVSFPLNVMVIKIEGLQGKRKGWVKL